MNTAKSNKLALATTVAYEGESIEDKVRRVEMSGEPVEAISPMLYTERKEGVLKETNIRTDKWDVAMEAMDSISRGRRAKREEMTKADKPDANGKVDVQD